MKHIYSFFAVGGVSTVIGIGTLHAGLKLDRVSVPSTIAIDILMDTIARDRAHMYCTVLVFCVNFERHICTHITTNIKCYLVSLRSVYVPFTYILCQSNWHVYISTNFENVNKPSTYHSYLQNKFLASKCSLI